MKIKFLVPLLFISALAAAQPGYLPRNTKERLIATIADSGLHVPVFDRPRIATGIAARDGGIFLDSVGGGRGLYYVADGVPIRLRDTTEAGGRVANGLMVSGDTTILGDSLNRYTYLYAAHRFINNTRYNGLQITNDTTTQDPYPYFLTYNPSALSVRRIYSTAKGDNDSAFYGSNISSLWQMFRDSTDALFAAGIRSELLPGIGMEAVGQYFPPRDSMVLKVGRDGQSGNVLFGQLDIGNSWGYNMFVRPPTSMPGLPISAARTSIDLSRVIDNTRRKKMTGAGLSGFTSMYKSYQSSIDMSTYSSGSYTDSIFGFSAYGDAYPLISGATKAQTLSVWEVKNAYGFYAHPQYRYTNTVRNGFAFYAAGDSDQNRFNFVRIGGGVSNFLHQLEVTGDVMATDSVHGFIVDGYALSAKIPVAIGTETGVVFGMTDSTQAASITMALPANRDARHLDIRVEGFNSSDYPDNSLGMYIRFETGANHANVSRISRNGNWTFGNTAAALAYRWYKKGAFAGSVIVLDSFTVSNLPQAPNDSTIYYNLWADALGNFYRGYHNPAGGGGGGITDLTGDVTASGSGSVATTLATVNSDVGSFTNANITVNAKGLITAASNGSGGGITVGTTTITSGTTTRILYNNAGVVGEYTLTGTGTAVAMGTSPVFTTDITSPIVQGSSSSGGTLTLKSTTNATKGKILFGTSAYDEVNNRLGIGTASPAVTLDIGGSSAILGQISTSSSPANSNFFTAATTTSTRSTASNYLFPAGAGSGFRIAINGTTATALTAGDDMADLLLTGSVTAEAGSGTSPRIGTLFVGSKIVTNGTGATDTLYGAYFNGPATGVTPVTGSFNTIFNIGNVLVKYGKLGVGINPTALIHLAASTTAASSGQIKFAEGTALTTPEDGTLNYVSDNLEFTETSTVYVLAKTLRATATLDFVSTAAQGSTELTITVTGAAVGDPVALAPSASVLSVLSGACFTAWVSSSSTVTVRFNNYSSGALDPASSSFTASVVHY